MKYFEKDKDLINRTKEDITAIVESQLRELVSWSSDREFIELELEICKRLNVIGAKLLESLIPHVYGNGYIGSRKDINIDSEDPEKRTSYRCESRSKIRGLKTVFGSIQISRAVYSEYYSGGQKSFLDEKLRIEDKKIDPLIKYWSDLLGTIAPFDEASDILNKIRGISISTKQVEISTESIGEKIAKCHEDDIKEILLNKKGEIAESGINLNVNAKRTVYIETDGCHINTQNDWKECKTFMLFELEKLDEKTQKLKNKFYYSTMNEVSELKRQIKYNLERYCGEEEVKIVCIGDGAKWIWKTIGELFPKDRLHSGIIEIVDWYHAVEKIGDIKKEIFAEKDKGGIFFEECKAYLKKGNVEMVEQMLVELRDKQDLIERKEFVDERMKYFMNNKERMRYDKFKDQGLCIGSGAIESANKYVVQRRLKLQGMKWNKENANHMAHLRAEYINKRMDAQYGIKNNPILGEIAIA